MPTRPDAATTWRDTKNGVRWPDDVGERRRALHQVVLVGAVAEAPLLSVLFLYSVDRRGAGHLARPGAAASSHHPLARLVPEHGVQRIGHLGAEYSGWAWSTYSRAPLVRITLARPRSSSVSLGRVGGRAGLGRTRGRRAAATPPRSPSAHGRPG